MKFYRVLFVALLLGFTLSSCEKVKPFARKIRGALERDEEPKQVVGLPPGEKKLVELPPPPKPVKMEPVVDKSAKVAVLGYHRFTDSRRPTDMIIDVADFRAQMQALKDSELPVISMRQFLDWKQGRGTIPPESVLITIDDGWKSTHSLAMPVLREFEFPFTVYLYQKYVNIGGSSMTFEEISELIEAGGTVCSHSITHDFMNRQRGRSDEQYEEWLLSELNDSHNFLVDHFGEDVVMKTFAYPYGAYNDRVVKMAKDSGYQLAFTVSPGKATWDSTDLEINRYIVWGNRAKTFDDAIAFAGKSSTGSSTSGRKLLIEQRDKKTGKAKEPLVSVYPPNGSTLKNRLPRIEVNLSNLNNVQSESISMRISGLGKVPHRYSKDKKLVSFQVPQRIRLDSCGVQLSFRHSGNSRNEVVGWSFKVDRNSEYLDPTVTFLRPADEPVNPKQDLLIPKTEEELAAELAAKEAASQPYDPENPKPQNIDLPEISPTQDF